jgi:hypothetical protein
VLKKEKKKAHNIELEIQISDIMYMLILDATDTRFRESKKTGCLVIG